jgi:hypothetical protein
MRTVYKYRVPIDDTSVVELPRGAQVIRFGCQGNEIFLWAVVDPAEKETTKHIYWIRGTGHPIPDSLGVYICSVDLPNGLVFHIFDAKGWT